MTRVAAALSFMAAHFVHFPRGRVTAFGDFEHTGEGNAHAALGREVLGVNGMRRLNGRRALGREEDLRGRSVAVHWQCGYAALGKLQVV